MNLINVNFLLAVQEEVVTDRWALFSLWNPQSLRLQQVTVTLKNPQDKPATVVEWISGAAQMTDDMMANTKPQREPFELEMTECFLRCEGDLCVIDNNEAGRVSLEHCAVATSGSLLHILGCEENPLENEGLEVRLEHVTGLVDNGLVRVHCGDLPRRLIPVQISARNNLFGTRNGNPLVAMAGNFATADFQKLLRWDGRQNFYDNQETFWSISSSLESTEPQNFNFELWRDYWGPDTEIGALNFHIGWRRPSAREEKRSADVTIDDLALEGNPSDNPAASGADDGTAAGADLTTLPAIPFYSVRQDD